MKTKIFALLVALFAANCAFAQAGPYVGDFVLGSNVRCMWNSFNASGASVTRATNGTIAWYEDFNTTQSTTGVTDTEDFDAQTGMHAILIAATSGNGFEANKEYHVALSGATIDGQTVNAELCSFSIERSANITHENGTALPANGGNGAFPSRGVVASGTAQAYTAGGPTLQLASSTAMANADIRAGYLVFAKGSNEDDWVVGTVSSYDGSTDTVTLTAAFTTAPTGTVLYVIFGTAANADIATILTRIGSPADLGFGSTNLADNLQEIESQTDDIGVAGAGLTAADDAVITLIGVAGAGLTAADDAVITAIAALNNLSQANIRTAVGLGSANLDTQLTAIDDYIDSEIAAIKAKTDQLIFTKANELDVNVQSVNGVTVTGDGSGTPFNVSLRELRRQMRDRDLLRNVSARELRELRDNLNRTNGAPQTIRISL